MEDLPKDIISLFHEKYFSLRDFMNWGQCSKKCYQLFLKTVDYHKMTLRYFPLYERHPDNCVWKERYISLFKKAAPINPMDQFAELNAAANSLEKSSSFVGLSVGINPTTKTVNKEIAEFFGLKHYGTNILPVTADVIIYILGYLAVTSYPNVLCPSKYMINVFPYETNNNVAIYIQRIITFILLYTDQEISPIGGEQNLIQYSKDFQKIKKSVVNLICLGEGNQGIFLNQLDEEDKTMIQKMDKQTRLEYGRELIVELRKEWQELGFPLGREN